MSLTRFLAKSLLVFCGSIQFVACSSSTHVTKGKPAQNDVFVSDIAVKSLDIYTTEHELWFSVKATVWNNTPVPRRIIVEIQGIDQDGFELKDFVLKSEFAAGQTKILTDTRFMKEDLFKNVLRLQAGEIFYGD